MMTDEQIREIDRINTEEGGITRFDSGDAGVIAVETILGTSWVYPSGRVMRVWKHIHMFAEEIPDA